VSTQSNLKSMEVAGELAKERCDQTAKHGWSREHDDTHDSGELAEAAAAYALVSTQQPGADDMAAGVWPLEWDAMRPKDRRRNLVIAGALIIAEIERIDRSIP
jgi:hypothetical protein